MKLRRIELTNFRQHAETAIAFGDGITGLIGANEAGKSTVLEAAAWALFGARATRGTKGSIRWNRAPARHTAGVELEFEVGGATYTIQRGESDAGVFEGAASTPIASGTSTVDEFVPGLIGMGLQEFEATFMCRQKDLAAIAAMGPTDRRRFFLEVLGVSRIDDALGRCRDRKNELGREHAGVQAGLGEREPLEEEYSAAGLDYEVRRDGARAAAAASEAAQAAVPAAEQAFAPLEAARKRSEELSGQQAAFGRDVQTAEKEVARLGERLEGAEGADPVPESELEAARAAVGEAQRAKLAAVEKLEDVRAGFQEAREAREKERAVAEARAKAARERARELHARVERIQELGPDSACPTCTRTMGEHFVHVEKGAVRELTEARKRAHNLEQEAEANASPSDAELELQAAGEELRQRVDELTAEVTAAADRVTALERRRNAALALASTRADLETWERKRDEARRGVTRVYEQIVELGFDEDAYDAARQALESARARAAEAKSAAAVASSNLEAAEARRERARKALHDYDRRAAQLEELTTKLRTHERAAEVLAAFRADRAGSIRPDLEELASGFVQLLTDGRHEGMVLDDDFNARLLEGGLEIEVASGGTEDVAALAMRLAVSQLIAERAGHPLSLLVLDEPFGSLDATRRGNVMALIRRLSGVFEQVLVISHVEELQESVDRAIVLEYDEASGATRVLDRGDEGRAAA